MNQPTRWAWAGLQVLLLFAVAAVWGDVAALWCLGVIVVADLAYVVLVDSRSPAQRAAIPHRWSVWDATVDAWRRGHPPAGPSDADAAPR